MKKRDLEVKNLKGLSGCKLSLVKDEEGNYSVIKFSRSKEYNERLQKQCLKQKNFKKFKHISSPNIFDSGEFNGLAYFRMEFIKGQTLADMLINSDMQQVQPILDEILTMLCESKHETEGMSESIFKKKIDSLKKSCSDIPWYSRVFECLDNFDWSNIPKTSCHGDLTAENIIVSGKNIYLIDFLDSFYDTWLIDVAKLLQDFELGWSFRYKKISVELELKMNYCSEYIRNFILSNSNSCRYLNTINTILLLNVCRIFPYAKDDVTLEWIENNIESILS